ncbi:Alpha/beta hydrolase family protein [Luteibacter sp. UNCMF331Sha3.1]|uniref:esterase/lipase family protein n=1 Tax=Luteibacter sp. UNCMF331Sha3.1 TaxID=1502760 RepID=UPI0008BCFF67|nr:alpha/beta hydrolase [Luteibacter sp. UNCMF331Sha3.1]SEM83373.1 Alpha/beta hydrolase family protein [Luteibacter sp. UNCMF331Sha3.1]
MNLPQPDVLLLHGLWMRGFAMAMLHRRLRDEGFRVHQFEYMSVAAPPEQAIARLRKRIRALAPGPVHVVGHSLGGILALLACRDDDLPDGRIVCLGSPLAGSGAARGLTHRWGGDVLLGRSKELLEHGLDRWDGRREVGVIAGRQPMGLGSLVGDVGAEHDGSVGVEETRLPGLAAHCVLETSHTGMLVSADVARQAVMFLREGRFDTAA